MTLIIGGAALFMANRIARPISRITTITRKIGQGDLDQIIPSQDAGDEVGQFEIGHRASGIWVRP